MNIDHKKPENRPLYIFVLVAVVVILLLNVFAIPAMQERSVEKTDYSTFLMCPRQKYRMITSIMW